MHEAVRNGFREVQAQLANGHRGVCDHRRRVYRAKAQVVSVEVDRLAVALRAERAPVLVALERDGGIGPAHGLERLRADVGEEHARLRLEHAAPRNHVHGLRVERRHILAHKLARGVVHAEVEEPVVRPVAHRGAWRESHSARVRGEKRYQASWRVDGCVGHREHGLAVHLALARAVVNRDDVVGVLLDSVRSRSLAGIAVEAERRAVDDESAAGVAAGAYAARAVEALRVPG